MPEEIKLYPIEFVRLIYRLEREIKEADDEGRIGLSDGLKRALELVEKYLL